MAFADHDAEVVIEKKTLRLIADLGACLEKR